MTREAVTSDRDHRAPVPPGPPAAEAPAVCQVCGTPAAALEDSIFCRVCGEPVLVWGWAP